MGLLLTACSNTSSPKSDSSGSSTSDSSAPSATSAVTDDDISDTSPMGEDAGRYSDIDGDGFLEDAEDMGEDIISDAGDIIDDIIPDELVPNEIDTPTMTTADQRD